jgi:hypothetical protein
VCYVIFKSTLLIELTLRVPLMKQELLTLPEHLSVPLVFSGVHVTRSLVLCVCFVDRCLSFCTFSFSHCVFCSSIYGFWSPLWCLQTLLIHTLYDNFCITKIKYIMYNVQHYSILYHNAVRVAICEGWQFTFLSETLAQPLHFTQKWAVGPYN